MTHQDWANVLMSVAYDTLLNNPDAFDLNPDANSMIIKIDAERDCIVLASKHFRDDLASLEGAKG